MSLVQIVAVTTAEIGPNGPVRKIYAVGFARAELALDAIAKKLKPGETADWIDARHLTLASGEIRLI